MATLALATLALATLALAALATPARGRGLPHFRRGSATGSAPRPSSANCTWRYITQQLDHFAPGSSAGTYTERFCLYSGYAATPSNSSSSSSSRSSSSSDPIFFYVGNESPVEEYVNGSGLMWELAPRFGAHLVFAEHRYFGQSVPALKGVENCLAYCTSAQALADYATLVRHLRTTLRTDGPVIAFGGSYGGMLASWARMKYPSTFAGAIAASAPIWGFPRTNPPLDGSFRAITNAATPVGGVANDRCPTHLVASWVLMRVLGETEEGRGRLSKLLRLCSPLDSEREVESLSPRAAAVVSHGRGRFSFSLHLHHICRRKQRLPYAGMACSRRVRPCRSRRLWRRCPRQLEERDL